MGVVTSCFSLMKYVNRYDLDYKCITNDDIYYFQLSDHLMSVDIHDPPLSKNKIPKNTHLTLTELVKNNYTNEIRVYGYFDQEVTLFDVTQLFYSVIIKPPNVNHTDLRFGLRSEGEQSQKLDNTAGRGVGSAKRRDSLSDFTLKPKSIWLDKY